LTIEIGNGPAPQLPVTKTCMVKGCSNPADWQVGLTLYGLHQGKKYPVPGETGLGVCSGHRPEITISDLITEEGWAMICKGFRRANKIEPTRSLSEIRFLPMLKL